MGSTTGARKIDHCDDWYSSDFEALPEATRELFEVYSGIPPEEVVSHVQKLQSSAFKIYPYPCIGQLRFLNLSLSRHPLYPKVLAHLLPSTERARNKLYTGSEQEGPKGSLGSQKGAPKLLDLGCCLAQDLRKLVFDGVPSENLYGLDLETRFVDLSYEFFRDYDRLKSQFVIEDLLCAEENIESQDESDAITHGSPTLPPAKIPLAALAGKMSIIAANSFFHLYNLADQFALAKRVAQLLSPDPGSLIVGRQVGSTVPGEYTSVDNKGTRYAHDINSFRRFWDQVASDLGQEYRFRVEVTMDETELGENKSQGQHWAEPNIRRLIFESGENEGLEKDLRFH